MAITVATKRLRARDAGLPAGTYPTALVALTVLAFALAFHEIGAKSLNLDESTSLLYAREPVSQLWEVVSGGDPNGGLYYVLLNAWTRVFGDGEVAGRALIAVVAGLTVPAVALLGGRLFGRLAGLVAGLLLALDGFFVQYAQTARSYPLAALLVTVSSYFFVAELERPSRSHKVGYVLASSLAIYAHYFAAYVLLVQLLTLLALRRRAALTREWLGMAAGVLVLCTPAAVFAIRAGTQRIDWIVEPDLQNLLDVPGALAGRSSLLGWGLVGLGAFALLRALREPERWRAGFVAAWFVVPVLVSFAVSFVQPMFVVYYLIVSLPALVLAAAAGLVRLPGRVAGAIVLVGLVMLSAVRLSAWYRKPGEEDYRGAARHVVQTMRPGDRVVYAPTWAAVPIEYYFHRRGVAGPIPIELNQGGAGHRRIWLVTRESDVDPQTQARLEASFAPAYERVSGQPRFRRVGVVLLRLSQRPRQDSNLRPRD